MSKEMKRRAASYDRKKTQGLASQNADETIFSFCVAASMAWRYPFDRWSDAEIDDALSQLALKLKAGEGRIYPDQGKLLHLTSNLGDGGGHVEALRLWCEQVGGDVM